MEKIISFLELFVFVLPSDSKESLCSLPFNFVPLKPLPNSNPFTAFIDNIAFPSSACSLSNTGSPRPIGQFSITQLTYPPIVSPSFLICFIKFYISTDVFESAHLTGLFSMVEKSNFE